ncbi:MAG: hypothetical protein F6K47_42510, partial [Symploca sp. SIO2E6]|nr:hypothetical protein [Symploca sp. SIO2E6]
MSIPTPKIDRRTEQDIINETSALVEDNTEWTSPTGEKIDAGLALVRIFGHLASLVRDRLNRLPDKNFIAFLNLLGAQSQPPQPAKVPLTFHLVEGSPGSTI